MLVVHCTFQVPGLNERVQSRVRMNAKEFYARPSRSHGAEEARGIRQRQTQN